MSLFIYLFILGKERLVSCTIVNESSLQACSAMTLQPVI